MYTAHSLIPVLLAATVLTIPLDNKDTSFSVSTASPYSPRVNPSPFIPGDDGITPTPLRRPVVSSSSKSIRGFSTCTQVTIDQYNVSPFKDAVEKMATQYWGSDFNVHVNWDEFPDQPLNFCFSSDPVDATFNAPPTCNTAQVQTDGIIVNGTADVTSSVMQGLTSTHTVTTEKSASISTATEMGVELNVPLLGDASLTETVTVTGTFTKGDTMSTAIDQQTTQTVTGHATKPGQCNVDLNVTTCMGAATAQVPAFYTGGVWFNYKDKKDGHWDWFINIDVTIPPEQRSDNLTLTDQITSKNGGSYTVNCP